jgi:glycosyltransferase involved in cell wall biosynthesis
MIKGLKENNVEVVECQTQQNRNKLKKYWQLIKKHQQIKQNYDIMVVGFAGHAIMPLAWLLAKTNGKKVVLDLFVSEYDSVILDRKLYPEHSLKAKKYWLLDWLACKLADLCLLDAEEHIKFFVEKFKIPAKKFKTILLSCDQQIFYPRSKPESSDYIIHYHGSYSPIQGVKYIVQAAKLLEKENIIFNIIGKLKNHSQEIELAKSLGISNINFVDFMTYEKLAEQIAKADLVLGMFGDTDKAMHCSAFKIVEGMAMKKPVVTGDTPALREIINDKETGLFCQMANSQDLADKILLLRNQPVLANKIAEGGYQFCLKYLTPKATGLELKNTLELLINNR